MENAVSEGVNELPGESNVPSSAEALLSKFASAKSEEPSGRII